MDVGKGMLVGIPASKAHVESSDKGGSAID